MRNLTVFILVAIFACGGLMLVGCKKKEEPTPTAETGTVMPETPATPAPPETPMTAATGAEKPTAEGQPGEGGM
jgi:hypothetical protein